MAKDALLLRLDPKRWPSWEWQVLADADTQWWFRTGRLLDEDLEAGIPVIVLGTRGLGVVAWGETLTGIEFRSDPDWQDVAPDFQSECRRSENRVCVNIRRTRISLEDLRNEPSVATLHTRRETATWLDSGQYETLRSMI